MLPAAKARNSVLVWAAVGMVVLVVSLAFIVSHRPGQGTNYSGGSSSSSISVGVGSQHSVGYVGCSNTADAVAGYLLVQNKGLFWRPYATGGGSLDRWTNQSSSYWMLFDQQVQRYGQPAKVWIEICELAAKPLNFQMVQQTIEVLKSKVPNATVFISPLNSYSPSDICSLTGPNGVSDATRLAGEAVSDGLALAGPVVGPLTSQNTNADLCHPNTAGEQLLGSQLVAFFDR